jgi:hypothetical protein
MKPTTKRSLALATAAITTTCTGALLAADTAAAAPVGVTLQPSGITGLGLTQFTAEGVALGFLGIGAQTWNLRRTSDFEITLANQDTGRCLRRPGEDSDDPRVRMAECDDQNDSQHWYLVSPSPDTVRFEAAGRCLVSRGLLVQVAMGDCHSDAADWNIVARQ